MGGSGPSRDSVLSQESGPVRTVDEEPSVGESRGAIEVPGSLELLMEGYLSSGSEGDEAALLALDPDTTIPEIAGLGDLAQLSVDEAGTGKLETGDGSSLVGRGDTGSGPPRGRDRKRRGVRKPRARQRRQGRTSGSTTANEGSLPSRVERNYSPAGHLMGLGGGC